MRLVEQKSRSLDTPRLRTLDFTFLRTQENTARDIEHRRHRYQDGTINTQIATRGWRPRLLPHAANPTGHIEQTQANELGHTYHELATSAALRVVR